MISIITITYNAERWLERTMRSVLAQRCKDYEYIIVDGGSKDGTIDIVKRLQNTASNPLIDIVTIVLGLTVGASTQASVFLTSSSIKIFVLGAASFCVATAGGLLGAKLMNLFLKEKINPMIGAAGVSAVPDSARVVEVEGQKYDPSNHLLMHAMAPNVSGVIGSAVAAGVMMSFLMM